MRKFAGDNVLDQITALIWQRYSAPGCHPGGNYLGLQIERFLAAVVQAVGNLDQSAAQQTDGFLEKKAWVLQRRNACHQRICAGLNCHGQSLEFIRPEWRTKGFDVLRPNQFARHAINDCEVSPVFAQL